MDIEEIEQARDVEVFALALKFMGEEASLSMPHESEKMLADKCVLRARRCVNAVVRAMAKPTTGG